MFRVMDATCKFLGLRKVQIGFTSVPGGFKAIRPGSFEADRPASFEASHYL